MVVIEEIQIDREKRLLLGCQYRFGRQIQGSAFQEQFQRTDALISHMSEQARRLLHDSFVMRSKALFSMVRVLMMGWVHENMNSGFYIAVGRRI